MTTPDWTAIGVIATALGTIATSVFSYLQRRLSKSNAEVLHEVKENTNGNLLRQTRIAAQALEELAVETGHPAHRDAADAQALILKQREISAANNNKQSPPS